jgi:predicted DNA-binding transcriptional regulator AlpA
LVDIKYNLLGLNKEIDMIEINGVQYISDKEASEKFGYSQSWFQKVRYEGNGPKYVRIKNKGKVLYPLKDLNEWFCSNLKERD